MKRRRTKLHFWCEKCKKFTLVDYEYNGIVTEDGINDESHTFLTYKKDGKFYWMEHAWNAFVGIHEYGTMNELLQDVKKKFASTFLADAMIEERLHCYLYDKPRGVLTVDEFYLHCKEGELIQL